MPFLFIIAQSIKPILHEHCCSESYGYRENIYRQTQIDTGIHVYKDRMPIFFSWGCWFHRHLSTAQVRHNSTAASLLSHKSVHRKQENANEQRNKVRMCRFVFHNHILHYNYTINRLKKKKSQYKTKINLQNIRKNIIPSSIFSKCFKDCVHLMCVLFLTRQPRPYFQRTPGALFSRSRLK